MWMNIIAPLALAQWWVGIACLAWLLAREVWLLLTM
jgi:hypothetical protein